jgi:hypothetical protein
MQGSTHSRTKIGEQVNPNLHMMQLLHADTVSSFKEYPIENENLLYKYNLTSVVTIARTNEAFTDLKESINKYAKLTESYKDLITDVNLTYNNQPVDLSAILEKPLQNIETNMTRVRNLTDALLDEALKALNETFLISHCYTREIALAKSEIEQARKIRTII